MKLQPTIEMSKVADGNMLEQLQHGYGQALKNLVIVNFSNKSVVGGSVMKEKDVYELELSKEIACCEDVITAINWHLRDGDYDSVRERIAALGESVSKIEHLENHIKAQRRDNLYELASRLCKQGKSAKVVPINDIRIFNIKKRRTNSDQ
ncbi:hypothetical protein [Lysinibacillus sp. RC79]|uniref:hypothetical protein n=1 Tax=Lysinibacillus sp. RC79 TaxID=3156296 RepID=UPI0035173F78